MKGREVLHSSASDEWLTPLDLWDKLNNKWRFTLDPCGGPTHLPCMEDKTHFFSTHGDGLQANWHLQTIFCNPPYSNIAAWVEKAWSCREYAVTVMLIPARTDTRYWHKWIAPDALKVEFLPGRLKFRRPDGGKSQSAPFPSCLVYF